MTLLAVSQIRKSFGTLTAVSDASLTIAEHEIIGLIGPNGSGKSTLLHTICGRTFPDSGSVILNGVEMTHLTPNKRARAGMAIKFQLARIYLEKSVRDNLLISLQAKNSIPSLLASRSRKAYGEKIESLIAEFQLADFADTPARSLSHGQQQWLEIAMAMSDDPVLLLLDEPTAGMSPKERADTAILIRNAAKRCGVLIVEHDLDFIKNLCDRISVLHYGELIATGTPNEIERNDRVREVYLTRV